MLTNTKAPLTAFSTPPLTFNPAVLPDQSTRTVTTCLQYTKGAITAVDLVRYLEKDVAGNVLGCDLDDVVAAALTRIPDTRKKDLLAKARWDSEARVTS